MKTYCLKNGQPQLLEIPKPQIVFSDDILIRVKYSLPEFMQVNKQPQNSAIRSYFFSQAGCGVVEEMSPLAYIQSFRPGDRVVWFYRANCGGCYHCRNNQPLFCTNMEYSGTALTENLVWKEQFIYRVPENLSMHEASFFLPTLFSCRIMQSFPVRADSTMLILGTSSRALILLIHAKLKGLNKVVVMDSDPNRLEFARVFGADEVILAGTDTLMDVSRKIAPDSGGFSVIVDLLSDIAVLNEAILALANGGYCLIGGYYPREVFLSLNLSRLYIKGQTIQVLKEAPFFADEALAIMPRMKLSSLISKIVPFTDIDEVFRKDFYKTNIEALVRIDSDDGVCGDKL